MTAMENYLDLVTEYQKAMAQVNVLRSSPLLRTPSMVAAEAKAALMEVIGNKAE
ncbi:hypothetical protein [Arthrobacter alpinus]|uniref:hypothetical protein n=1 Tax=Arthrobacter alpinus TaxID=656366 RepID=UPI0012FF3294|nr:hypothetical protein [Arthrobacter alpinus]